ncbi:hypothetical protein A9Q74_15495 [Colwellia sp. 39_35_sub15_T18]|nr:hypothetical protein A9Q74_15495 [Colwellia sp. 39_35_sub15_T18]
MSVINQMLKDLEQRTPEQGHAPNAVMASNKPSTVKIVAISLVVLLSLNALGFYIWDLQTRLSSSELKAQENKEQVIVRQAAAKQPDLAQHLVQPLAQPLVRQAAAKQPDVVQALAQPLVRQAMIEQPNVEQVAARQPATKQPIIKQPTVQPAIQPAVQSVKAEKTVTTSKMTVSRRQLTTKELVTQKLVNAEKAINSNQITKAETLFEDVLIIEPSNKQARKKLAALWFGRKAYQQAVNLLSQGIALDKRDSELRMLKAQIQLQQGQHKGAYHTLKALPDLKQQDYQVMLANVAQQVNAYESAIKAYQTLIKMHSYSGKWHLGLAIVYDKNSQFRLAEKEYALALSKSDLSTASAEFAAQRMQALGE